MNEPAPEPGVEVGVEVEVEVEVGVGVGVGVGVEVEVAVEIEVGVVVVVGETGFDELSQAAARGILVSPTPRHRVLLPAGAPQSRTPRV